MTAKSKLLTMKPGAVQNPGRFNVGESAEEAFEYCMKGMCIKSAFNVLAVSLGESLYPHPY